MVTTGNYTEVLNAKGCDYVMFRLSLDSAIENAQLKLVMITKAGNWSYVFDSDALTSYTTRPSGVILRAIFSDFSPDNGTNKTIDLTEITGYQFVISAVQKPAAGSLEFGYLYAGCLPSYSGEISSIKATSGLAMNSISYQTVYQNFYGNDLVESDSGYGVYGLYGNKDSLVVDQDLLNVWYDVFTLASIYSLDVGWTSVRREFKDRVIDVSGDSGISFDLKVDSASGASLRFTLCDVSFPENVRVHGSDEQWWITLPNALNQTSAWHNVKIPFSGFSLSYGFDTRQNDWYLNKKLICAYEINIVGHNAYSINVPTNATFTTEDRGVFSIRNISVY